MFFALRSAAIQLLVWEGNFQPHDYNSIFSEAVLCCSDGIHQVSLVPSTTRLYFLNSAYIWMVLLVSYIVRTFHGSILIFALVVRMCIGVMISEESRLSPLGVVILLDKDPWAPRSLIGWNDFFLLALFSGFFFHKVKLLTTRSTLHLLLELAVVLEGL